VSLADLRRDEFDAAHAARELRRAVFEDGQSDRLADLIAAEQRLEQASHARAAEEAQSGAAQGPVVAINPASALLGPATTGLDVDVQLRMTTIPTSLVHTFQVATHPLVSYTIKNTRQEKKRLRLISYVEGYSARAVTTVEVAFNVPEKASQLPTFFPSALAGVTELTRASVNVEVQDLDQRTEVHTTVPVWLLARTSAPLQVLDPSKGTWLDVTPYLGAFVTPNAASVTECLRAAAGRHPQKKFVGYQQDAKAVEDQVRAIYEELTARQIIYVNSIIDFTPEAGTNTQRVRLPRETLQTKSANCIDGTLLMASLLESASINPAIVIVPGHAYLGWETGRRNGQWAYVETTVLAEKSFDQAVAQARDLTTSLEAKAAPPKRHSLRDLRAAGITPAE